MGGRFLDYSKNSNANQMYDPETDAWTDRAPMPTARSGIAVAVYGRRMYVLGGEDPHGVFRQNEAYDTLSDSWSEETPMPEGRHGTGAAVINGRIYIPAGGATNGGSSPTNTLFYIKIGVPPL